MTEVVGLVVKVVGGVWKKRVEIEEVVEVEKEKCKRKRL